MIEIGGIGALLPIYTKYLFLLSEMLFVWNLCSRLHAKQKRFLSGVIVLFSVAAQRCYLFSWTFVFKELVQVCFYEKTSTIFLLLFNLLVISKFL